MTDELAEDGDADILGRSATLARFFRSDGPITWEGLPAGSGPWDGTDKTWGEWLIGPFRQVLAPHICSLHPMLGGGDYEGAIEADSLVSKKLGAASSQRSEDAATALLESVEGARAGRSLSRLVTLSPAGIHLCTALVGHARDHSMPLLPILLAYCRLEFVAGGGRRFEGEVADGALVECMSVVEKKGFPPLQSI